MMFQFACAAIGLLVSLQAAPGQSPDAIVEEISRSLTTATGQPIGLPREGAEVIEHP